MVNEMKMFVNGQEIKIPFNMEEMFKQLVPQPQREIPKPMPQQIVRKVLECRDTGLRNVVIEMNQRLLHLEELVNEKKPVKKKVAKLISKKNGSKKINAKSKK